MCVSYSDTQVCANTQIIYIYRSLFIYIHIQQAIFYSSFLHFSCFCSQATTPFQLGMFPAAGPPWKQGSINALSDAGATCDLVTQKVATCWQHRRHCEIRLERSILAKGCGKKIDLTRCHSKTFFEGIHGDLPMALICGWELLVVDLDDCFRIIQGIVCQSQV